MPGEEKPMKRWRVHFYEKNGDETRSLVVDAVDEEDAESQGELEANNRGWPSTFKVSGAELLEEGAGISGKPKLKPRWKVFFFNFANDDCEEERSLVVRADTIEGAYAEASKEADRRGWPKCFEIDYNLSGELNNDDDEEDESI